MGLSISSSLFICSLLLLLQPSLAIYCDEDDCYDLLGYSTKYPSLLLLISLFSFFSFSNLLLVLVGFRRVPMPRRSRKLITSSPSNSTPLLLPPFQATFITFFFFFLNFLTTLLEFSFSSHPDKNPDPESRKLFVKIANAYEVCTPLLSYIISHSRILLLQYDTNAVCYSGLDVFYVHYGSIAKTICRYISF